MQPNLDLDGRRALASFYSLRLVQSRFPNFIPCASHDAQKDRTLAESKGIPALIGPSSQRHLF